MGNWSKKTAIFCLMIGAVSMCKSSVLAKSPEHYDDIEQIVDINVEEMVPKTLGIIFPKTVSKTVTDYFVVHGISDPDEPLYMNDQEITDRKPNGIFEVKVSVPNDGVYSLVFRQGDKTKLVPIFKNVEPDLSYNGFSVFGGIKKNTFVIDSSIFPTQNMILSNKKVKLQCSAPSGAKVSAMFCGSKFQLKQENGLTQIGVTAKYSVEVDLSSIIEDGKTYDLGQVVYIMDFDGQISEKQSVGKIYYSEGLPSYVRVCWEYGKLMSKPDINSNVISVLKKGVTDRLVAQENDFYQLACGAWISKRVTEPVFEDLDFVNHISNSRFVQDEKAEKLILEGNINTVFTSELKDNRLLIRLYNTIGNLDLSSLSKYSVLFDDLVANQQEGYLEFIFDLKSNNILWGYNVEFDGNDTIIYLKKRPVISGDSTRPLDGITVLVDPGHGGSDCGALGLIGEISDGTEKMVNLSNARAIKNRLESLGANVIMTRDTDIYVSLSDRATIIEQSKPDFIIVVHADASLKPDSEGATVHFTRANRFSEKLSSCVVKLISEYTERLSRGTKNTDFYVSGSTFSPTAFLEVGYLTNLKDAASLFSNEKVFDLANAVGDAIVQYLSDDK